MAKLPNAEKAVVDLHKLTDYCLNPNHMRGKHKAHLFEAVLGITMADAEMLQTALLAAALNEEAELGEKDDYGQRYTVDFTMKGNTGEAVIRSAWIIRTDEDFPRLTSCYVL